MFYSIRPATPTTVAANLASPEDSAPPSRNADPLGDADPSCCGAGPLGWPAAVLARVAVLVLARRGAGLLLRCWPAAVLARWVAGPLPRC